MSPRVGVDTGGTFTDFVGWDGAVLVVHKVRSTPADPAQALLTGLAEMAIWKRPEVLTRKRPAAAPNQKSQIANRKFPLVVHGSTVGTNAILERKGARVALLTTAGFEDVLQIGRQTRPELYNHFVSPRRPLVKTDWVFGVAERLDAAGHPLQALQRAEVGRLLRRLAQREVEVVAVCLLHSYAYPAHERRLAAALRKAGFTVCASHEVLAEYREFERWSTTVLNAYVTPLMDRYLRTLEQGLGRTRLRIMQSNGGTLSSIAARAQAVRTILSGPAGGVVGARAVARAAGYQRLITFDMGGTSTDVSLVDDQLTTTTNTVLGDFPVRLPVIDVHSVGAGGGSIAAVDTGGALCVGPQSAGADPGPACYGIGERFTVADANLLLGRLDAEHFLGGRMGLDAGRAATAGRALARQLRLTLPALAEGVVRVANATMERAIRRVSLERGHDPRDFVLVAFGGAGGMHACALAEPLGITTVLVPRCAGVLSALGLLFADVTKDYSASVLQHSADLGHAALAQRFQPLLSRARRDLAREGFGAAHQVIEQSLDVRYVGQSFEITVPFTRAYRREFDQRQQRLYGYANPDRPVEIVNVRVKATGITEKPSLPYTRPRPAVARPLSVRPAWFGRRLTQTGYYDWQNLSPGARASGPAIITGGEATVVVPPGHAFRLDGFGNVIIQKIPSSAQ